MRECDILLAAKFDKFEKLNQNFSKFFNSDHIMTTIESKANLEEVQDLLELKVEKHDLQKVVNIMEVIYERIK